MDLTYVLDVVFKFGTLCTMSSFCVYSLLFPEGSTCLSDLVCHSVYQPITIVHLNENRDTEDYLKLKCVDQIVQYILNAKLDSMQD